MNRNQYLKAFLSQEATETKIYSISLSGAFPRVSQKFYTGHEVVCFQTDTSQYFKTISLKTADSITNKDILEKGCSIEWSVNTD
jgi:hypothetical protein